MKKFAVIVPSGWYEKIKGAAKNDGGSVCSYVRGLILCDLKARGLL